MVTFSLSDRSGPLAAGWTILEAAGCIKMTSGSLSELNSLTWTYSRQTVQWTASGVLQSLFPVRALYVQVGQRAADKIVFSMTELIGNIWMMENISE